MPKTFELPSSLRKAADSSGWVVGGVASSFHRDLDGEAITPQAVRDAISEFMAPRGVDGVQGGEIRLHHNFWDDFLRQAIDRLNLPREEQMRMVAAIALPLGRVTKMWVDDTGKTHWQGLLSRANPISGIIWQMLREKLIALGVSLGGKIFATQRNGRDVMGRICDLITKIRIDELSVTSNPALRLTQGEDTGAYITALSKSVKQALTTSEVRNPMTKTSTLKVKRFLAKALGNEEARTVTGMEQDNFGQPKSVLPKGSSTIKMDATSVSTRTGGKSSVVNKPMGSTANEPPTDVWGMTVEQFTRALGKAACKCDRMGKPVDMKKAMALTEPGFPEMAMNGAYGLTHSTDAPSDAMVNFVRFLQRLAMTCSHLPGMSDWERDGTVSAMSTDLYKSLEEFTEKMPKEIMARPLRPPGNGAPMPRMMDIAFPHQYAPY